jgi:hypothetical protein
MDAARFLPHRLVVALGVMTALVRSRLRAPAGMLGVLAFGLGLGVLAGAGILGRVAKDRPRIDARVERTDQGLRVKGTVKAAGLKSDEHVVVRVVGMSTRNRLAEAHVGHRRGNEPVAGCEARDLRFDRDADGRTEGAPVRCWRRLAYGSPTGASADGTVEIPVDAPLATGLYERVDVEAHLQEDEVTKARAKTTTTSTTGTGPVIASADSTPQGADGGSTTATTEARVRVEDSEATTDPEPRCDRTHGDFACVSLMLPPSVRRPELAAHWKLPATDPPQLVVTARMGDLSVDDRVLLSVWRMRRTPRGVRRGGRVYGASWAPGATGQVSQTLTIPVDARGRPMCVVMRTLRASVVAHAEAVEAYGPRSFRDEDNRPRGRSQGMSVQLVAPPGD